MKIIIYHSTISKIGGCETFIYNWCKNLRNYYDITFMYKSADINQLMRISRYVRTERYDSSKKYKADICICSSAWNGFPDSIEAKEYIQMLHADYEEMAKTGWKYYPWSKTTKHVAVSKTVADSFERLYKIKPDLIYNILDKKQETKPILKLISATRLSKEKGYQRMITIANNLKSAGVKFRWIIFTDRELYKVTDMNLEEVIYMKPRYDIQDYIEEADYGVQLSDTEGYSYFINECLQYGTAMLVTDFPSAHESVVDGENGYILNKDLSNLDIDKIVNQIPKGFNYKEKTTIDTWTSYLGGAEYKEKGEINIMVEIEVITAKGYDDTLLGKHKNKGDRYIVSLERAEQILNTGWAIKVRDIKEEIVKDKQNLNKLTNAQLICMIKEKGIEVREKSNKAQLIKLLEEN